MGWTISAKSADRAQPGTGFIFFHESPVSLPDWCRPAGMAACSQLQSSGGHHQFPNAPKACLVAGRMN